MQERTGELCEAGTDGGIPMHGVARARMRLFLCAPSSGTRFGFDFRFELPRYHVLMLHLTSRAHPLSRLLSTVTRLNQTAKTKPPLLTRHGAKKHSKIPTV